MSPAPPPAEGGGGDRGGWATETEAAGLLATARAAAAAGAEVVRRARRNGSFSVRKKSPADYVTEVDLEAERAIVAVIRSAHPDHAVLGEEGTAGAGAAGDPDATWVIDPLDGTTNFIHDLPAHAVAVSHEQAGVPVVAVVVDPVHGHAYEAVRGGGARCNGRPLAVSGERRLSESLILTGIPFRNLEWLERFLADLREVAQRSGGVRRMGSAALDLCHVAAGRAEAFWEYGLARWDVSAGSLLVEEAGGRIGDCAGGGDHLASGDVVASNGHVHADLLACLGRPASPG